MSHIKNLVFEGGGILGLSYVGAIEELSKYVDINKIDHYAGTSAGAIIAAVLACRADITTVKKIMSDAKFSSYVNIKFTSVLSLPYYYGLCSGDEFSQWFKSVIYDITKISDPTLRQVYDLLGTTFTCAVTNINTSKCEYFSTYTHPELKLVTAVRASMSIPFIFNPVIINNIYYVDGGLTDNFMMSKFDTNNTLGIGLGKKSSINNIASLSDYIHAVVNSFNTPAASYDNVITINTDMSPINFAATQKEIDDLVSKGRNSAAHYISKQPWAILCEDQHRNCGS